MLLALPGAAGAMRLHTAKHTHSHRFLVVDDSLDAAQSLAPQARVAQPREVAEGELHVDAMAPEAPRIADESPHGLARLEERTQQGGPDGSRRSGDQDHGAEL